MDWIPGQAWNDKNTHMRSFANYDKVSFAGMTIRAGYGLFT